MKQKEQLKLTTVVIGAPLADLDPGIFLPEMLCAKCWATQQHLLYRLGVLDLEMEQEKFY